jgi:hypothetical protein
MGGKAPGAANTMGLASVGMHAGKMSWMESPRGGKPSFEKAYGRKLGAFSMVCRWPNPPASQAIVGQSQGCQAWVV